MENVIINFFKNYKLDIKNKKMVVAVSTGVDSMALLFTLLNLKKKYNIDIIVAHVNHGKRIQSEEEEQYITKYCTINNIKCYVKRLDFKNNTENFQSIARDLRYNFFNEIIKIEQAHYLVLAHHANDNMETILMRMIRGSNLIGYSGINEVNKADKYLIIRPFLSVLKNELIDYVNLHKIKYYEDYSNQEDIYTRNRIRKDIIPKLFLEDKNVHHKFNEFSNTLKSANKIINGVIDKFIKDKVTKNENISFSIYEFLDLDDYLQTEVLFKLLKSYSLSKNNILDIIKQIKSSKKNILSIIKSKFTFVKEYDKIFFYNKVIKKPNIFVELDDIKNYHINDSFSIIVTKKTNNIVLNNSDLWYNSNMFPVVIRTRLPGDKIKLNSGYKKVKDLLIDEKIGILKRDRILILEDKNKEILAVIGVKKSIVLKEIKNYDILIKVEDLELNG